MKNISFEVSGIMLEGKAKAMHPNKDGFYENVPLMVLGKPSRNGKIYTVDSMMDALTNPSSIFVKQLRASALYGCYGHPVCKNENDLVDIATINMEKVSHQIGKVYTGETTEQGHTIVYGWIKPFGPYGQYLRESFEDSTQNTCFSLRSLVEKVGQDPNGNIIQKVQCLVTIDHVLIGGYAEAAKVYDQSVEGYSITIDPTKAQGRQALATLVSQEVISDHQLEDMLGMDKVTILHNQFDIGDKSLLSDGHSVDLFHTMFNH